MNKGDENRLFVCVCVCAQSFDVQRPSVEISNMRGEGGSE